MPKSIIDLVRELQELPISMRHVAPFVVPEDETDKNARRIIESFPAIAAHILEQEEKLKVAVEALKFLDGCLVERDMFQVCRTCIEKRKDALSRLLPLD